MKYDIPKTTAESEEKRQRFCKGNFRKKASVVSISRDLLSLVSSEFSAKMVSAQAQAKPNQNQKPNQNHKTEKD